MEFSFVHTNFAVKNLQESLAFYQKALGLTEVGRKQAGSFTRVFLSDGNTAQQIELTYDANHPQGFDLGDNQTHIAFRTKEYEKARQLHQQMGCITHEIAGRNIYFIADPDGNSIEILLQA